MSDTNFQDGVNVNKTITINGNGFYLNGNDEARILNITADNVVLSNIKFINGYSLVGGAIFVNGTNCSIDNCYFTSNDAYNGGTIFIAASGCSVDECPYLNIIMQHMELSVVKEIILLHLILIL